MNKSVQLEQRRFLFGGVHKASYCEKNKEVTNLHIELELVTFFAFLVLHRINSTRNNSSCSFHSASQVILVVRKERIFIF
jgi:hypothetical protein